MRILLAVAMVFGSTACTMAGESHGDYRNFFDAKPVTVQRAPRSASKSTHPIDLRRHAIDAPIEMYRYDDGGLRKAPDMRPRSWDGGYVPKHPRNAPPDGFWSPIDQSFEGREPRQQRFR